MPGAGRMPHTELRVLVRGKKQTERIIALLRNQGIEAEIVKDDDDERVDVFATGWYRETSAEMTPGDVLRIRRENAGLTQEELGKRIGSNRQNISAMERGRRPIGEAVAERLATALNLPVTALQRRW